MALCCLEAASTGDAAFRERKKATLESLMKRGSCAKFDDAEAVVEDELRYGRVGYAYALVFARAASSAGERPSGLDELLARVVTAALTTGQQRAKACGIADRIPLLYSFPVREGSPYVGAAHGVAGILHVALLAMDVLHQDLLDVVNSGLLWLANQRRAGNWAMHVTDGEDTDLEHHVVHFFPRCRGNRDGALPRMARACRRQVACRGSCSL